MTGASEARMFGLFSQKVVLKLMSLRGVVKWLGIGFAYDKDSGWRLERS
ncbi:hypothetical protein PF005_g5586 [Phytophthora fragariae]|nr:hypothetical protein PF003_g4167 [Phytophthora fragariae]KAE8935146.1 hypothetical protein PF009_g14895 [Phytophthora fragariae]KAE8997004.1 hypothetical protein PF011_g15672 [Phytophthora fragariae]KAE9123237.1 hypothetical protein PF007_g7138 [Phytophthora fragariae]KAE9125775.1 hypothetical protein PF010_g5501 [Phytophthora fragariae]